MRTRLLSSTDLAIAVATRKGTLRIEDKQGRFGPFVAISDDHGLIEVADDRPAAERRVAKVTG